MAIVLPDVVLVKTVNLCLTILRDDYNNHFAAGTLGESLLYILFGGLELGRYAFFENAKQIIVTTPENPKHIEARLSFDQSTQNAAPVIWITLPAENNKNNSIGVGEGINSERLISNDPDQDERREMLSYRWQTTYQIVIAAENRNEVLILYYLLKSMIVACIGHLHIEGIENLKLGGQDVRFQNLPGSMFQKAITLNFEYEYGIPKITSSSIYRTIRLFWKEDQATTAQGPLVISVTDDLSPSDSASV